MFKHYVLLTVILIFFTTCGADSNCCQKVSLDYLDAAVDFIAKAKSNFPSQVICDKISVTDVVSDKNKSRNAIDCSELLEMGYKKKDVYTIWPKSRILDDKQLEVYCDMETDGGGWTVIQRRIRLVGAFEDFNKDWKSYKEGFGDIQKEFWLGNDNIFALSNQRQYSARFDMRTLDNKNISAYYETFWIDGENSKYTLHIADYKGDTGDAMASHQNQKFSAKDEDNDKQTDRHCAEAYSSGWWYNDCYTVNLNGKHDGHHLHWHDGNATYYLQSTEIKIRPRNFKPPQASSDNTPM